MKPEIIAVTIQANSSHCGIKLKKLPIPESCLMLGLVRNNKVIFANINPAIWCGDYIVAITLNSALIPALKLALKRTHRVYYSLKDCPLEKIS